MDGVRAFLINIVVVEGDQPFNPDTGDNVIRPVQTAQQCRFAAAGRADKRRDLIVIDIQIDIIKSLIIAIPEIDMLHLHLHVGAIDMMMRRKVERLIQQ